MRHYHIIFLLLVIAFANTKSQQLTKLFKIPDWTEIEYQNNDTLFALHYGYWVYKCSASSGSKIDSFKLQISPNPSYNEEARGLCWDGSNLWISEWGTDSLYKIDTKNGKVIHKIKSPGSGPQGLAYGAGALWHTDEYQKTIFKINPLTGTIIKQLPIAESSGWFIGVAYYNGKLWLSNHINRKIYQIDTSNGAILNTFVLPSGLQPVELTMKSNDLHIGTIESGGHFVYNYSTNNTFTVYPNQHTVIVGDSAKRMLPVKLSKGYYTITTEVISKPHAGGDIDGVFFWATTGENSAKWPAGHAVYETFRDNQSVSLFSPTGFDGYLFFMDGGNLSDNFGSVSITFKLDSIGTTSIGSNEGEKIPLQFHLSQNFPNPFNPTTNIRYEIKKENYVTINIYDMIGRTIKTLITEFQPSGNYTITWDGKNENGELVATGTYLYQLKIGEQAETKKMILIK